MKKVLGGVLVLLSVILIGNVKAVEFDDLENAESNVDVKVNQLRTAAQYSIELSWESLEYDYVLTGYDYDHNTRVYEWQPTKAWFDDDHFMSYSNEIYAANRSNVPVSISFSWNSALEITPTFAYSKTIGELECAPIDIAITASPFQIYTDNTCETEVSSTPESGIYYYKTLKYDSVNGNNTSFTLPSNPDSPDYGYRAEHKWNMNLSGQVNPASLTPNTTIGTLTITLSDVE